MTKFKIGDKARVLWSDHCPETVGKIVTILSNPQVCYNKIRRESWVGVVTDLKTSHGADFCPRTDQLAPLTEAPKREIDTVVSWSDCAWQPQQVRA